MDRTTKTLLTFIAVSLVWLGIKDLSFISDAMAASGVIEVRVVEIDFSRYKPVPVEVKGEIKCKE